MAVNAVDTSVTYTPPVPESSPPPEAQNPETPPEVRDISSELGIGNNIDVTA